MKNVMLSENKRKDKLFEAWDSHLEKVRQKLKVDLFGPKMFQRTYEGVVEVTKVCSHFLELELEAGEKIKCKGLSPDVLEHSRENDGLTMVLGLYNREWFPIEIISIASYIPEGSMVHFHYSIHPELMAGPTPFSMKN